MGGVMELQGADVEWNLSLERQDVPLEFGEQRTYRSITIDEEVLEFSHGFDDLHTRVYERTLAGQGFGIDDARVSIELVHKLRTMEVTSNLRGSVHPDSARVLNKAI